MKQSNPQRSKQPNDRQLISVAFEMQAHSSSGLLHSGHLFGIASPGTGCQLWPQLWPTRRGRHLAAAAATLLPSGNQPPQATSLAAPIWGRAPSVSTTLMLPPVSASDARGLQAKPSGSMLCITLHYYCTKSWGLVPEEQR